MADTIEMKVECDEWYPVYALNKGWGKIVKVTQELIDRQERIFDEFQKLQHELSELYDS